MLNFKFDLRKLAIASMASLTLCINAFATQRNFEVTTMGTWIIEKDGSTMLDPQTSGLSFVNGDLYSISDASAHDSQIQRLHKLSHKDGRILEKLGPIRLAENMKESCFAAYLSERPDFEALVNIPNTDNAWMLVTEDARRGPQLSAQCQQRFKDTGSTDHPTLIVRLELTGGELVLTGVRAIQFDPNDEVGKFDNDGIEGLTITKDKRVLLGLEKDAKSHPRVFEFIFSDETFAVMDAFLPVTDSELLFPPIVEGMHPINGMDVYYPNEQSSGYLIAAARNADQLWILDLAKKKAATVVDVNFFAPSVMTDTSVDENNERCAPVHQMTQTALEGLAVHNDLIYLVNDPWKQRYEENVKCPSDAKRYQDMSPLFFTLSINPRWFK